MKTKLLILPGLLLFSGIAASQNLLEIASGQMPEPEAKVSATFKTTRVINAQTNETVHKRTLDFRVGHRFGNVGSESNGGVHTLYGLDAATDIRIALEYGITDRLMAGVARYKRYENLEGLVKYRLFEQTNDNKIPVAVTAFANVSFSPERDVLGIYKIVNEDGSTTSKPLRRMTYCTQLILARKFSSKFSIAFIPAYVHRNYVIINEDENDVFALGAAGRFKITKSTTVIADYFFNFSQYRRDNSDVYFDPLGVGFEIETGGHVFTIMFTNAPGILENDFLVNTTDTWEKGGFKFSFNISRNFKL